MGLKSWVVMNRCSAFGVCLLINTVTYTRSDIIALHRIAEQCERVWHRGKHIFLKSDGPRFHFWLYHLQDVGAVHVC